MLGTPLLLQTAWRNSASCTLCAPGLGRRLQPLDAPPLRLTANGALGTLNRKRKSEPPIPAPICQSRGQATSPAKTSSLGRLKPQSPLFVRTSPDSRLQAPLRPKTAPTPKLTSPLLRFIKATPSRPKPQKKNITVNAFPKLRRPKP